MLCFIAVLSILAFGSCQQASQEIAFSYGLSHDLSLSNADIVKFDARFSNYGNGYNEATGKFVAPVAGIYVFQFHALSESGGTAWLELYHNAKYVCSAYGHNNNDYMSAGNSAILQLDNGDQVFLRAVDPSYGDVTNMYGRVDEIYSTFSGYMISPVFQEIPGHNGK